MNVLDENISRIQRQLLHDWRIPVRHIGYEIGRKGMKDDEIIPFLLTLQQPAFDRDYFKQCELRSHHQNRHSITADPKCETQILTFHASRLTSQTDQVGASNRKDLTEIVLLGYKLSCPAS